MTDSPNLALADELETRVEQVVDGEFELGVMVRVNSELPRILDALRAQPSGDWVWVPREPTKEMLDAGYGVAWNHVECDDLRAVYRAMLSAAKERGRAGR